MARDNKNTYFQRELDELPMVLLPVEVEARAEEQEAEAEEAVRMQEVAQVEASRHQYDGTGVKLHAHSEDHWLLLGPAAKVVGAYRVNTLPAETGVAALPVEWA